MINNSRINLIADTIDVSDRGLNYGDGLFETIAYVDGQLHNWDLHWQRLLSGAQRLLLSIPDKDFLAHEIALKVQPIAIHHSHSSRVIKIIITRGSGGRGYHAEDGAQSTLLITVHPWPERSESDYTRGIHVKVCQTCLAQQTALAGIKHLNRLEQVLAASELNNTGFDDGLMLACNYHPLEKEQRKLIEAVSANVFWVKNNRLYTPLIDRCGVDGTIRQQIMALTKKLSIDFEQSHVTLQQLSDASEVFLSNSIFGIVPVASISIRDGLCWTFRQQAELAYPSIASRFSAIINHVLKRPEF